MRKILWFVLAILPVTMLAVTVSVPAQAGNSGGPGQGQAQQHKRGQGREGMWKQALASLNLSQDQEAQIKSIEQTFIQKLKDLRNSNLTPDQKKVEARKLKKDRNQAILKVLTPDQRTQLKQWIQQHRPHKGNGGQGNAGGSPGAPPQ